MAMGANVSSHLHFLPANGTAEVDIVLLSFERTLLAFSVFRPENVCAGLLYHTLKDTSVFTLKEQCQTSVSGNCFSHFSQLFSFHVSRITN